MKIPGFFLENRKKNVQYESSNYYFVSAWDNSEVPHKKTKKKNRKRSEVESELSGQQSERRVSSMIKVYMDIGRKTVVTSSKKKKKKLLLLRNLMNTEEKAGA